MQATNKKVEFEISYLFHIREIVFNSPVNVQR